MSCYFRMKRPAWAEETFELKASQPGRRTSPTADLWLQQPGSFAHRLMLDAAMNRQESVDFSQLLYEIKVTPMPTDQRVLGVSMVYLDHTFFTLDFPRYHMRLPGRARPYSGQLSAWSSVNLGLEEHTWIPPNCNCFVFAHPPEGAAADAPRGVGAALSGFFRNGGYVYFNFGGGDESLNDAVRDRERHTKDVVNVRGAVAIVDSSVVQSAEVPEVFPSELQLCFHGMPRGGGGGGGGGHGMRRGGGGGGGTRSKTMFCRIPKHSKRDSREAGGKFICGAGNSRAGYGGGGGACHKG